MIAMSPGRSEFTFNYEMGLAPEIEVKLDKVKESYYSIKVDDKMVDEEVNNLARRFGSLSEPEKSEDSDMLMGTFIQLTPEGEILEGGIMNDGTVSIEFVDDKKTKKAKDTKKTKFILENSKQSRR